MTSARFTNAEHTYGDFIRPNGTPTFGPLPPNDGEILAEYEAWIASGGVPEPYTPFVIVPETISDRQFFQALAGMGVITTAEALAAVKTGTIPAALQAFIDTLSNGERFAAEMLISGATTFSRSHPMVATLAAGMGWSNAQVDALWQTAAAL